MKTITAILSAILLMAATVPAMADNNRPIGLSELPAASQKFIKTHFSNATIEYAFVDSELFDKEYRVVFEDGCRVEFSKSGAWREVDCKLGTIPMAIVPQQIASYMAKNHPKRTIRAIECDKRGYEVKTDNGLELKFNQNFKLVEIDD